MSLLQRGSKASSEIELPSNLRPIFAGVIGGGLSTAILHPLDLLKTKQAVHGGRLVSHLKNGLNLYQGVGVNVLVSASSWGVYFATYETLKARFNQQTCTAAFGAGLVTTMITNPLSVVRSRMMLKAKDQSGGGKYANVFKSLAVIAKSEGLRGFYKGLIPNLVNVSHGTIQFVLYEELKKWIACDHKKMSNFESLGCCVLSKLAATLVTHPCQNMRARKQAGELATVSTFTDVWAKEGLRGFYRGLWPSLLHVTPNVCVVFLTYEFFVGTQKSY